MKPEYFLRKMFDSYKKMGKKEKKKEKEKEKR